MSEEAPLGLTLWSTDIDALARFLEQVAGLTVEARHPGFAELRAGSARVTIHADEAGRAHPWYKALAREGVARGIGAELRFRVGDIDAAFAAALRLGGLAIQPVYDAGQGRRECQVMGPDGFVLALWE